MTCVDVDVDADAGLFTLKDCALPEFRNPVGPADPGSSFRDPPANERLGCSPELDKLGLPIWSSRLESFESLVFETLALGLDAMPEVDFAKEPPWCCGFEEM